MPDAAPAPRSKRAVPVRAAKRVPAPRPPRIVAVDLPDPTPSGRPGFRVLRPVEAEPEEPPNAALPIAPSSDRGADAAAGRGTPTAPAVDARGGPEDAPPVPERVAC